MAKIYVADDDPDIRELVSHALVDEGHVVMVAHDGRSALEATLTEPPDLLVLDIMMPRLGGLGVLDALSAHGIRSSMKVLLLTANGREKDRIEGLDRGADRYLNKPFHLDELLATVKELLAASSSELALKTAADRHQAGLLARLEDVLGTSAAP